MIVKSTGRVGRAMSGLLFLAAALVAPAAGAQPGASASEGDTARAAELFREGRLLLQQRRPAEACARFRQSLELKVAPGILLNVGACHVLENHLVEAFQTYEQVYALALREPDERKRDAWLGPARQELDALGRQLAVVTVRFSDTPGLEVHLDGKRIESSAGRLPLLPGTYELRAMARGRVPFVRRVEAAAGTSPELTIPPLAPAPLDQRAEEERSSLLPWTLVGAGSALVVAGAITGLVTAGKESELAKKCKDHSCPDESEQPGFQDKIDESKRLATITNVLWGVGLASVGVGVTLLVLDSADEPAADVRAGCYDATCGMTVRGRF
jgi:hypothetical protein